MLITTAFITAWPGCCQPGPHPAGRRLEKSGARDQPRGKNQLMGFPVSWPMRPPIAEALLDRPPWSLLEHIAKDHQTLKGSLGWQ